MMTAMAKKRGVKKTGMSEVRKLVGIPKELDKQLTEEARMAQPEPLTWTAYVRRLLTTHPDRPANQKKK